MEDSEITSNYIMESFQDHPNTKDKIVSLIYNAKLFHYPDDEGEVPLLWVLLYFNQVVRLYYQN